MSVSVASPPLGRVTLADVEKVLPLKSWWAIIFVLPVVRRLTLLVVNYTSVSPNAITIASILLRLAAAGLFLVASQSSLVGGAVIFYLAYVLDCMDGAVARLRRLSSELGRYLDHLGDLVGGVVMVAALAAGQKMLLTPLAAGLIFCHVAESYISYLATNLFASRSEQYAAAPSGFWSRGAAGLYVRYRTFCHRRNLKTFFSFPDYEAVLFLIFPVIGNPGLGLQTGFYLALAITLYTVFSTFVTFHAGGKRFP